MIPHALVILSAAVAAAGGAALAGSFKDVVVPRWWAAVAALCAAGLGFWPGGAMQLAAVGWLLVLIVPLTALAVIDAATHRLPDILSLFLVGAGLSRLWLTGEPVMPVAAAAAFLIGAGLVIDRVAPDAPVGAGDFLLAAAGVVWLGFMPLIELAIIVAVLLWLQFLIVLGLRAMGKIAADATGVPLAPTFAIAVVALWLAGQAV